MSIRYQITYFVVWSVDKAMLLKQVIIVNNSTVGCVGFVVSHLRCFSLNFNLICLAEVLEQNGLLLFIRASNTCFLADIKPIPDIKNKSGQPWCLKVRCKWISFTKRCEAPESSSFSPVFAATQHKWCYVSHSTCLRHIWEERVNSPTAGGAVYVPLWHHKVPISNSESLSAHSLGSNPRRWVDWGVYCHTKDTRDWVCNFCSKDFSVFLFFFKDNKKKKTCSCRHQYFPEVLTFWVVKMRMFTETDIFHFEADKRWQQTATTTTRTGKY